MLSTIKEDVNDIDEIIFIVEDNKYNGICSIFASQSTVFDKLIKKKKENKSNEIYLKHMTLKSFCFIRNIFYDLQPILTYNDAVDVLYSSIKYKLNSLINQTMHFLMEINNLNHYFIAIKSFSNYPRSLFQSFFVNNFVSKSQFIHNNIDEIISDDKFITYSSLFQLQIFCQFALSEKLINHQKGYNLITKWCRYQYNNKFKPLLLIKENEENTECNLLSNDGEISINNEQIQNTSNISNDDSNDDNDYMIRKWQDLFEDFLPLIDFSEISVEYLLTQIRSDHIMLQQDLLSILLQKYENDKRAKAVQVGIKNNNKYRYNERRVSIQSIQSTSSNLSNLSGLSTSTFSSNHISTNYEVFKRDDMFLKQNELKALNIGSKIDLRDEFGRYIKAEIIEINHNKLRIHFIGWNKMWDKWIDIETDYQLITYFGNITDRDIHKTEIRDLVIGDKVIVKMPSYHKHHGFGWINAQIINMDKGQLNVQYKLNHTGNIENDIHEFWVHADNINECR